MDYKYQHCSYSVGCSLTLLDQMPRLANLQYMAAIGGEGVEIIKTLAPAWYQLGIRFDFDQCGDLVSRIRAQERDHVHCCDLLIRNWLAGKGKMQPATWRVLIKLLKEMEQNALVDKIQLALGKNRKRSSLFFIY